MYKDIMVDLETMGNGSDAAIIAIGAVAFSEDKLSDSEFYQVVDLQSSVDAGLKIDPSTVLWWMKQSDDARQALFKPGSDDLYSTLYRFGNWIEDVTSGAAKKDRHVWGNGATFDNMILRSAFELTGEPIRWEYYGDLCYRTLKKLYPSIKLIRTGTHHNALDDAKSQAEHAMALLAKTEYWDAGKT
jgi:exodeoxyribonuclease VIII